MTISTGRCQYILYANSVSELGVMSGVSFLLRVRNGQVRGAGERVVDHHDVQHAGDNGVNPAQFDELIAADVDGVEVFFLRRALETAERKAAVLGRWIVGVVLVNGRPCRDADPELSGKLR